MDFGVVGRGEVAERYLYVSNTGDGLVEGVVRSLVPWLQAFPRRITCASGELVQVALSADCASLSDGVIDIPQAVRVQTNSGARTLSLRMQVRAPRLALDTPSLDFGVVPLGKVRERPLVIRNEGSAPLEATIQSHAAWVRPSEEEVTCQPGDKEVVQIRADTSGFVRGQEVAEEAALRIVWSAGIEDVPASITVLPVLG